MQFWTATVVVLFVAEKGFDDHPNDSMDLVASGPQTCLRAYLPPYLPTCQDLSKLGLVVA